MARVKRSIVQRVFSFMEVRQDFLEADGTDIRSASLRGAKNMRATPAGTLSARPGSFLIRSLSDADEVLEVSPDAGLRFGLILNDDSFEVINESGHIVFTQKSVPWTRAKDVWTQSLRKKIVLGSETSGIHVLEYDDGKWTFSDFEFLSAIGGELAQPYWVFEKDLTIRPSGISGNITITASGPIWTPDYVGQRIRYGMREIKITKRISSTVLRGTVVNELPPSWLITVEKRESFRVGEAVVGAETNFQGLVVGISGNVLSVVTTHFFDGPDVEEELSCPSGSSKITAREKVPPHASPIWDEPLISPRRGFPRSCVAVAGRLMFLDFPKVPDLLAVSSSRAIEDFDVGANDDDAIVRRVGDGSPRWLHAVNMGDLVLLSDSGLYYMPVRESGNLSPSNFGAVFIDEVGASEIRPIRIDEGVIFVEASGETVSAAVLDGNVYLKWSVRRLTDFHDQQIRNPVRLCGPSLGSTADEKFMFVVNADGTLAGMTWTGRLTDQNAGFAPWDTNGKYINVVPFFGEYWAIVDRETSEGTVRFLERFDEAAYLDCTVQTDDLSIPKALSVNAGSLSVNGEALAADRPVLRHLPGATVTYYANGWDGGDHVVAADGTVPTDPEEITGNRQIGLNFVASVAPWPAEITDSRRIGMLRARIIRVSVSVLETLGFKARCNNTVRQVGYYDFGEDFALPPAPRTKVYRFAVYGNRDHPEIEFIKDRPGPFNILAIGQEVQA